ncbi:FAS1-like dehydratase domain-containing protein [Citreimonas sp.]|uniref:FAS1-like dehydratase domain-containing protein n=1 Tax=Citreimonas sp. TaxID=3036715 RepID=UPI0040590328
MATGGYVSDLEKGDRLGPIRYTVSAFTVREYCHSVELDHEAFLGIDAPVAPPTLVHLDKLKLYEATCPKGTGPSARLHVEFDATYHAPVPVGAEVEVSGEATDRFEKRGRTYVVTDIRMREAGTGRALIDYRDTVILAYRSASEAAE